MASLFNGMKGGSAGSGEEGGSKDAAGSLGGFDLSSIFGSLGLGGAGNAEVDDDEAAGGGGGLMSRLTALLGGPEKERKLHLWNDTSLAAAVAKSDTAPLVIVSVPLDDTLSPPERDSALRLELNSLVRAGSKFKVGILDCRESADPMRVCGTSDSAFQDVFV